MDWQEMAAQAEAADGDLTWITARYEGRCRGCGQHWAPGDLIAFDPGEGGWICAACGAGEE